MEAAGAMSAKRSLLTAALLIGCLFHIVKAQQFSKSACHSGRQNLGSSSCTGLRLNPNLCSSCKLRQDTLLDDGSFLCNSVFDLTNVQCQAEIKNHIDRNSCDTQRIEDYNEVMSNGWDPSSTAYANLDFFVYGFCELCCDCIPFEAEFEAWSPDYELLIDVTRGNCAIHAEIDLCWLYPNLDYAVGFDYDEGTGIPEVPSYVDPSIKGCTLLTEFRNTGATSNEGYPNMDNRTQNFLSGIMDAAQCAACTPWSYCYELEWRENRIQIDQPYEPIFADPNYENEFGQVYDRCIVSSSPTATTNPTFNPTVTPPDPDAPVYDEFPTSNPRIPQSAINEIFASSREQWVTAAQPSNDVGRVAVSILKNNADVETSNFGSQSFQIQNYGSKEIVAVLIDCTGSLLPDAIFDETGAFGDSVAKGYTENSQNMGGSTSAGKLQLTFTTNDMAISTGDTYYITTNTDVLSLPEFEGYNPGAPKGLLVMANNPSQWTTGKYLKFSIDMDPNCISGFTKSTVDNGALQNWDIGGISGAEMINSQVCVLFRDGAQECALMISDGSNAGSITFISTDLPGKTVDITVTTDQGIYSPGETGGYTFRNGNANVEINVSGESGDLVRVVVARGFQPVTSQEGNPTVKEKVEGRLEQISASFPANNFIIIQSFDIILDENGEGQVLSSSLNLIDESYPYAIVAAVMDQVVPNGFSDEVLPNDSLAAMGSVTDTIYLLYGRQGTSSRPTTTSPTFSPQTNAPSAFQTSGPTFSPQTSAPSPLQTNSPSTTPPPPQIQRTCFIITTKTADVTYPENSFEVVEDLALPISLGNKFACQFTFDCPLPLAMHKFTVSSNDGTLFYINDELIISNDGQHVEIAVSSTLMTSGGFCKLLYFQNGGTTALSLTIDDKLFTGLNSLETANPTEPPTEASLSESPTFSPSNSPSSRPSLNPSSFPSLSPSLSPTLKPSNAPTSLSPTTDPSSSPSKFPSVSPSLRPSCSPSLSPSLSPTFKPSNAPTSLSPTSDPSSSPSKFPSLSPTLSPSQYPSISPSFNPSLSPSKETSWSPSESPSKNPTPFLTTSPSTGPSEFETDLVTSQPSMSPVSPSRSPSLSPSLQPSVSPSLNPSDFPSISPSSKPSLSPSANPSKSPSSICPSLHPSLNPTKCPSTAPTKCPSFNPSMSPSLCPTTSCPTAPSLCPTVSPSLCPTRLPTVCPTTSPITDAPFDTSLIQRTCLGLYTETAIVNYPPEFELISAFELPENSIFNPPDEFACRYQFKLPLVQDSHKFELISNDGTILYINDELILNHDGLHTATAKSVTTETSGGIFTILYFQRQGTMFLQFLIDDIDINVQLDDILPILPTTNPTFSPSIISTSDPTSSPVTTLPSSPTTCPTFSPSTISTSAPTSSPATTSPSSFGNVQRLCALDMPPTIVSLNSFSLSEPTFSGYLPPDIDDMIEDLEIDGIVSDYFACEFVFGIYFDSSGDYTFELTSNDGSSIAEIGKEPFILNDGRHGAVTVGGIFRSPAAGVYNFRIKYFQWLGGRALSLNVGGNPASFVPVTDLEKCSGGASYLTEEITIRGQLARVLALEVEGLLIEGTDWEIFMEEPDFTGFGYLDYQGSNSFNVPGIDTITVQIYITFPGTYRFQWRNTYGGTENTEENDSWLRFPDADEFYSVKDGLIKCPAGGQSLATKCDNNIVNGATSNGWLKVFTNSAGWTFNTKTSDFEDFFIYADFNEAKVYTLEISGRSRHHKIDRIVMWRIGDLSFTPTDNDLKSVNPTRC